MNQWKWYAYELLGVWWQRKDENIKWPSASADLSAISNGSSGTGRPLLSLGLGHSLFRSGFQFHFLGFWVCALLFAVPHTILLIFFPLMALSRGHTTASIACRSDFRYSPAFTNFTIIVALFLLRQLACIFFHDTVKLFSFEQALFPFFTYGILQIWYQVWAAL